MVSGSALAAERLSVPYEIFRLKNGLTVIVHEDHSAPIVTVNAWYHVGSAREVPGRTGFAHLFEHIMFNGSKNVQEGEFDQWLEAVGENNNESTTQDRTNYWEDVPANALETALFLESDRMAYLLDSRSMARVNQQRDVVKNERRQSYEMHPVPPQWSQPLTAEFLLANDRPLRRLMTWCSHIRLATGATWPRGSSDVRALGGPRVASCRTGTGGRATTRAGGRPEERAP
ncbi:MAG TPA: insulinase family protein [Thermoanaerobaculia bacterium]